MTTMTIQQTRVADDELRRELGLSYAGTACAVAAITVDGTTGEILVACVCTRLGWGRTEEQARADLADAHATVPL